MALFFVPFGVGLIDSYEVIMDNAVAIVIATVVSTFAVIIAVGWVFQLLNRDKR
jgi:holin-like protein